MIYHSICFSFGDAKDNSYIKCLELLYKSLHLQPTDVFYVTVDPATEAYLKTLPWTANIRRIVREPPADILSGMLWKYEFIPPSDSTVIYLDTDILQEKPFYPDMPLDTIAIIQEGESSSQSYRGCWNLPREWGATAGFFVYRYGPSVAEFFRRVCDTIRTHPERFYTLDQPAFNLHLPENVMAFPPRTLSFNARGDWKAASFINFAGIPGDGQTHYNKMATWPAIKEKRLSQRFWIP